MHGSNVNILMVCSLFFISCASKETVKSRRFLFEIQTWAFSGPNFDAFMYNTDIDTYSSERRGGKRLDENALYVLRHDRKDTLTVTDSLIVKLSGVEVDSLFTLAYGYLSGFEIDNEVEVNEVREVILDGANIAVLLGYDGKRMQCSEHRLRGVRHSSKGGTELVKFINNRVPKEFRLY